MTDETDLAVILSYQLGSYRTASVNIVEAALWNEHNPHHPVADGYDAPRQFGPVWNNLITYGERVPDKRAADRVLRAHERRLGLPNGVLKPRDDGPQF